MLDRRGFLAMLSSTLATPDWWRFGSSRNPFLQAANAPLSTVPGSAAGQQTTADQQLAAEMQHLATRVYSEEGIAMILACEDLTAAKPVAPSLSRSMNRLMSAAIERYTSSWQRLHPNPPAGDVAKLVELLAYKDFSSGGKDTNL